MLDFSISLFSRGRWVKPKNKLITFWFHFVYFIQCVLTTSPTMVFIRQFHDIIYFHIAIFYAPSTKICWYVV
jgi:hypothetical protein